MVGRERRGAVAIGVLFGLVLLIAFTAFVLRQAEDAVRDEAQARVRSTAELTARLVDEQSLRFGEVVTAYASRLEILGTARRARLTPEDARLALAALDDLRRNVDGIDSAVLTDRLGRVVAVSPAGAVPPGRDLSGRDWFRGLAVAADQQQQQPYLSRAYLSTGPRRRRITVAAVRVRDPDGGTLGLLAAAERGRVQRFADAYGEARGVTLTVTDQAGTVVGRTGRASERLVSKARDPLVRRALAGSTGVAVRDVDGRPTVSGYAAVPRTGWTVVADVPSADAFGDVTRLRVTLLVGAGVVAFLLLWLVPLLVVRLGRARERLVVADRFQADLLPSELPEGVRTLYVASEKRMLLGGDFLDAVRTPDGGLALLIGDVCGHGPRAAALGARLRAGWRVLAGAGRPVERLDLLDAFVESERFDDDLYATVLAVHVDAGGTVLRCALAGHPPLLVAGEGGDVAVLDDVRGPALGFGIDGPWAVAERTIAPGWTLVLYTDGLIEARLAEGGRLEVAGLRTLVTEALRSGGPDELVRRTQALADHGLDDDLALLVVSGLTVVAGGADLEVRDHTRG